MVGMNIKIKNKDTRKLVLALERYGCEIRHNHNHIFITCPLGRSTMSTKRYHADKQWNELRRLGIDMDKLADLL